MRTAAHAVAVCCSHARAAAYTHRSFTRLHLRVSAMMRAHGCPLTLSPPLLVAAASLPVCASSPPSARRLLAVCRCRRCLRGRAAWQSAALAPARPAPPTPLRSHAPQPPALHLLHLHSPAPASTPPRAPPAVRPASSAAARWPCSRLQRRSRRRREGRVGRSPTRLCCGCDGAAAAVSDAAATPLRRRTPRAHHPRLLPSTHCRTAHSRTDSSRARRRSQGGGEEEEEEERGGGVPSALAAVPLLLRPPRR